MSLNNATVKVAEEVGYDKVADLAKSAGITSVKATPAMALGSYDASPLEMAGAYTVFANNGVRLSPILLRSVRNAKGDVIANYNTDQKTVLDPRIAYVMTNMMEGVINNGLGYTAVRLRGFTPPAAGKTGSSHDGWFGGGEKPVMPQPQTANQQDPNAQQQQQDPNKKKGFFGKIAGIFKDDKKSSTPPAKPAEPQQDPPH